MPWRAGAFAGVVLDLHLGTEVPSQPVERGALGGPHVGRRDDAQGRASLPERLQAVFEEP